MEIEEALGRGETRVALGKGTRAEQGKGGDYGGWGIGL